MRFIEDVLSGDTDFPLEKVRKYRAFYENWKRRIEGSDYRPQFGKRDKKPLQPPMSEVEALTRFPCIYREKTVEQYRCRPCNGSRVHTICNCLLLDRSCTVRASDAWDHRGSKKRRVLCCMRCEHRNEERGPMDHAAAD